MGHNHWSPNACSRCSSVKGSSHTLQREKACTQQHRPSTAKNNKIFPKKEKKSALKRVEILFLRFNICAGMWDLKVCLSFVSCPTWILGFPGGASGENPCANAGDTEDIGSNPGLGRSPVGERGNSPQYSDLETPIDRGAWGLQTMGLKELGMTEQLNTHISWILCFFTS